MAGHASCDANLRSAGPLGGGLVSSSWLNTGAPYPTPVDPNLKSPSTDEVVAGAEYELLANARIGASYTYRNLVRTVEDMSTTGGLTYFLGNPGEGIGSTFPKATRTYNAVTVFFNKTFADLWLAQVSYTWSRLYGNYDGLFAPNYGPNQLDPNITALFDFPQFLKNGTGNLAGDVTHAIKVFLAKEFVITPVFSFSLGGSFNANSGFPIEPLGSDPAYGDGIVYILQRGTTSRTPWVTSFDAKLGLNYRLTKDSVITVAVEGEILVAASGQVLGPGPVDIQPTPLAYAVQEMPSSYLIDARGKVVEVEHGFRDERKEALERRIQTLLAAR